MNLYVVATNRHLYSQFIVVATNSTHVTHEVLARVVSEGVVLKEPEKILKNVFLPPIKMVRWGVSSIQNGSSFSCVPPWLYSWWNSFCL